MKKISLLCAFTLACLSLAACGNTSAQRRSESAKAHSEKIEKAHQRKLAKKRREKKRAATKAKKKKEEQQAASSSSSQQQGNQQNGQQQNVNQQGQLTQGEINRQRGYDPNGNPLLPGQDHAAGSNPDGSPDAWVQWQIDHQNDTTFPDGTPFPNGGNESNTQ